MNRKPVLKNPKGRSPTFSPDIFQHKFAGLDFSLPKLQAL